MSFHVLWWFSWFNCVSWVSKNSIAMYSTVHWFHVMSVERCFNTTIWNCRLTREISFREHARYKGMLCYRKDQRQHTIVYTIDWIGFMSWVLKDAFLINLWMVQSDSKKWSHISDLSCIMMVFLHLSTLTTWNQCNLCVNYYMLCLIFRHSRHEQ